MNVRFSFPDCSAVLSELRLHLVENLGFDDYHHCKTGTTNPMFDVVLDNEASNSQLPVFFLANFHNILSCVLFYKR
jgi:hypothetical protein